MVWRWGYLLFVVIRLSFNYGAGSVELFDKDEAHHLV